MALDEADLRRRGYSDADVAAAKRWEAMQRQRATQGPPSKPTPPTVRTPMQFLMDLLHGKM